MEIGNNYQPEIQNNISSNSAVSLKSERNVWCPELNDTNVYISSIFFGARHKMY